MRKVMLVIDEIQQLVGLEAFLRRLGFDVLSLGKESQVSDALLGFNPEMLIISAHGRNVDGAKLAARVKKEVKPSPRVAICYVGAAPIFAAADLKSIDAFLELPMAGEAGIHFLAALANISADPLIQKYRKFAGARLSTDEQVVIVHGAQKTAASTPSFSEEPWDPKKNPGRSAEIQTERSKGYDRFLESRAEDLKGGAADKVMPRDRANQLMSKLKKDSEAEKAELDRIQAEKIKFAEAMFKDDGEKP